MLAISSNRWPLETIFFGSGPGSSIGLRIAAAGITVIKDRCIKTLQLYSLFFKKVKFPAECPNMKQKRGFVLLSAAARHSGKVSATNPSNRHSGLVPHLPTVIPAGGFWRKISQLPRICALIGEGKCKQKSIFVIPVLAYGQRPGSSTSENRMQITDVRTLRVISNNKKDCVGGKGQSD